MLRSLITLPAATLVMTLATAAAVDAGDVRLLKQPATFPLVIGQPGSYRLKGNITVPDANTTAISVAADNVTLDLNGYSIIGPTVCSGGPPITTCTPSGGTGNGIDAATAGKSNTTVLNGTVQGMGNRAIYLLSGRVEAVSALSNGGGGVYVDGHVERVRSLNNGGLGILGTTITGCTAGGNFSGGIFGTTVTGCTSAANGFSQIAAVGVAGHNICQPPGGPCP